MQDGAHNQISIFIVYVYSFIVDFDFPVARSSPLGADVGEFFAVHCRSLAAPNPFTGMIVFSDHSFSISTIIVFAVSIE